MIILTSLISEGQIGRFRTTTASKTAELVAARSITVAKMNIFNRSYSDSIYVKAYDQSTAPTYTDTPMDTPYLVPPRSQIYLNPAGSDQLYSLIKFYIRCTKSPDDTSNLSPTLKPIITINYR